MKEGFETLTVLSPHIDDAIFSIGLSIADGIGKFSNVQIINCFSISNFMIEQRSQSVHTVTGIRKNEDKILNRMLHDKIKFDYLDMLDFPLRQGDQSLGSIENLFLISTLARKLHTVIDHPSVIYAPLSVGDHIDHLICLEAILKMVQSTNLTIAFYEDLPYSQEASDELIISKVRYIESRIHLALTPKLNTFLSINEKEQLINAYSSQLNESVADDILNYSTRLNGERVWQFPNLS